MNSKDTKEMGKSPCPVVVDIDNEDTIEVDQVREENKEHASGSKKVSRSVSAIANNEVVSSNNANNILLEDLKLFAHNG
ncbi:hypothetical protein Ahy_A02g007414 isoform B [Arachis hypogaea]|uniref:Uncharacterized protein n=1 Tax=Arachis hypogaea TaxID=3818 RepID=A0A445ECP7_ARAHY|nr:hypothetical protein Ahy_A02g007414 isoform B [Arachis hypogaea]